MKKTLALLLALLMVFSVALVSCGNDDEQPTDTQNNDFVSPGLKNTGTGTGTGTGKGTGTASNTFVDKNDTVYVLCDANIREEAKMSGTLLTTVPFKTALQRTKANNKWSEVTYTNASGNPIKGYIANDLITTNAKSINFIAQGTEDAPVVTKIKDNLGTGINNAVVRSFPLASSLNKFQVLSDEDDAAMKIAQIPKGTADITVISVSEDGVWAYIKGVGNLKASDGSYPATSSPVEGYCLYSVLEISGATNNGGSTGGIG